MSAVPCVSRASTSKMVLVQRARDFGWGQKIGLARIGRGETLPRVWHGNLF